MAKMRELDKVGSDYPLTGPNRTELRTAVNVPASTLFNCLADGAAWKEWLGIDVEWTSPSPRGEGSTRTVKTSGQTIEEHFFAWDEGERMSFRFDRSTLPLKAMAEHYECVPTGDESSELVWSYAFEWGGPLTPLLGRAFGAGFAFNSKRSLKKLAALLDAEGQRWA